MGPIIRSRQVEGWQLCGIPRSVSSVRHCGSEHQSTVELKTLVVSSDGSIKMGNRELENAIDHGNSCDVLDARRLQQALRHFTKSDRYEAIRRFGVGLLVTWCISATALAAISQYTVYETRKVLDEVQAQILVLESRQAHE